MNKWTVKVTILYIKCHTNNILDLVPGRVAYMEDLCVHKDSENRAFTFS
jgi:hypothetical protein